MQCNREPKRSRNSRGSVAQRHGTVHCAAGSSGRVDAFHFLPGRGRRWRRDRRFVEFARCSRVQCIRAGPGRARPRRGSLSQSTWSSLTWPVICWQAVGQRAHQWHGMALACAFSQAPSPPPPPPPWRAACSCVLPLAFDERLAASECCARVHERSPTACSLDFPLPVPVNSHVLVCSCLVNQCYACVSRSASALRHVAVQVGLSERRTLPRVSNLCPIWNLPFLCLYSMLSTFWEACFEKASQNTLPKKCSTWEETCNEKAWGCELVSEQGTRLSTLLSAHELADLIDSPVTSVHELVLEWPFIR